MLDSSLEDTPERPGAGPGDAHRPVDAASGATAEGVSPGPATPSGGDAPGADPPEGFLASSHGRAFRALTHRPYRLLFTAFVVNQTGFWLSHISLQGLMVELSGNDPLWIGYLFFALFIPAFALVPVAGVAADRMDRKRIQLTTYTSVSTVSAVLAVLTFREAVSPEGLLALALVLGTCFAFSMPAGMALAANAVPVSDLTSAVSLQSAANNLPRVLGPAIAAPIVATSRFELAFAGFALAAGVAALLTWLMRVAPYAADPDETGVLSRLSAGFRHARERRPALPAILTVATLTLFGVSHVALLPVFAEVVLGDVGWFAWLVATTGLGAMLGAISIGYRRRGPSLPNAAGLMLAYGGVLAVFALSRAPALALIAQFAIGYFYFGVMTSLQTLVQQIVDEGKRGRVMSLFQVAWAGLVPWGGLAMGATAGAIGVVATLLVAAGVCAVYALGVLVWARVGSGVYPSPTATG